MLYFAYGSNMDWAQMMGRCPSARFIGIAVLPDHRLAFTRCSRIRGCGVADAVPDPGSETWGVIYEIDDRDVRILDACEGYEPGRENNAYRREERHVYLNGNKEAPMLVSIYFASRDENYPLPNQAYKDLILSGAKYWHLPDSYIENVLSRIEVSSK